MYIGVHVKYRYSCQILMKLEFSHERFSKNPRISNSVNMRPAVAEFSHADRRTDMTKLIVAFRTFANAPNNTLYFVFWTVHFQ